MRTLRDRLEDILEAMDAIEDAVRKGRNSFEQDRMLQVWMIHHIQIIGEAVRASSEELRKRRPDLPWAEIIGMRSILVHDYFGIDLDEVWTVAEKDIPSLKPQMRDLLMDVEREQPPEKTN